MKELLVNNETNIGEILLEDLECLIDNMGLSKKVKLNLAITRSGDPEITFSGIRDLKASWGSGLNSIADGNTRLLIRFLAKSISNTEKSVDSIELLSRESFRNSCSTEVKINKKLPGNKILNQTYGIEQDVVPCFYGSTSGLNFAEVLETVISADSLRKQNVSTQVLFETSGHESARSLSILNMSKKVIPNHLLDKYDLYYKSLGNTLEEQSINAANNILLTNVVFAQTKDIFKAMGKNLTAGKIAILAKIAGENPFLFSNIRSSDFIAATSQSKDGKKLLSTSVNDLGLELGGFTYYAREAVLAGEYQGYIAYPFKLTTHANIYRILESYESLASQRSDGGAILCPIQRQRIQTRDQSRFGGDPCDVTVLAFLAEQFPDNYEHLIEDFKSSCKVLTPDEAREKGTTDNRFIVEDYFPIS